MAIFDNVECSIVINDEVVAEYDIPSEEDDSCGNNNSRPSRIIEQYIESQVDQNFAIRFNVPKSFQFTDGFNTLRCDIIIDGKYKDNVLLIKANMSPDGTITRDLCGATQKVDGRWEMRKFRFSRLAEDEVRDRNVRLNLKHLGDIKVRMTRVVTEREPHIQEQNDKQFSTLQLSERSVKGRAVDSVTTLDESVDTAAPMVFQIIRNEYSTWATFNFRYRSTKNLQQLGIVEVPLCEKPLEDREPASLNPEEMLELLRRQQERLQQQEDTVKLVKRQLNQSQARLKRSRSPAASSDNDENDDEIQIVKKPKRNDRKVIIELD